MAELTPQDMAAKLLATGFERSGPSAATLSDPIADTPMVVTLDQLRPYDHDPRVTRNPAYAEIKASIRERGLDAPPAITRRPGEAHYIIRNGGNTRLAILRELWSETKEERFFRIACLFRPWPARGEIVALTGHLAENELRGGLTFIERALGIEKAREFYEQESGQALSQSELARRLTADGYPVPQSHISRMNDAVRYLLPAIPNLLYGGLGRHQVMSLYTTHAVSSRSACMVAAASMTRCKPSQMVFTPGSPSPLRARKPPRVAISRSTWLTVGGVAGGFFLVSRYAPRISSCSKKSVASRSGQVRPVRIRWAIRQATTMNKAIARSRRSTADSCRASMRQPFLTT